MRGSAPTQTGRSGTLPGLRYSAISVGVWESVPVMRESSVGGTAAAGGLGTFTGRVLDAGGLSAAGEGEQVGVEDVAERSDHRQAVRGAGVNLELGTLDDLG